MKRIFVLSILAALLSTGLLTAEEWTWDADRADGFYQAGDYDAAWLFYERALAAGVDDGQVVFRAAESFRQQQMIEDPAFGKALYAVARYFLQSQYPDAPAISQAEAQIGDDLVVTRRVLKKTYAVVGGKAPKSRPIIDAGVGTVSDFITGQLAELGELLSVVRAEGFKEAAAWAKQRAWSLLLTWLLLNALTGIILPAVMAVTVAREGRKSYVTAYLFLLHWGPLGIHRFYLGRHISGIVWLCTGGLLGLGVFFDFFLTGAYVRFWNEDHKDDRPVSGTAGRLTGTRVKSQKVKPQRSKKTKPPKPPKVQKTSKARTAPKAKKKEASKASSEEALDDGFAMGAVAGAGLAAADSGDNLDFSTSDEDFGDLPDLAMDDDQEDFPMPSTDSGDDFTADFQNELNDDEFDLGSLD